MKTSKVLLASSLEELRELGGYLEIKNSLEKEIDNKIGVNSWKSLFNKIERLKQLSLKNKSIIFKTYEGNSFENSKKEVSKKLDIKITARGWAELYRKITLIVDVFCFEPFNPYSHYEKTKLKKFRDSSNLEGISIRFSDENNSLESVLERHRK